VSKGNCLGLPDFVVPVAAKGGATRTGQEEGGGLACESSHPRPEKARQLERGTRTQRRGVKKMRETGAAAQRRRDLLPQGTIVRIHPEPQPAPGGSLERSQKKGGGKERERGSEITKETFCPGIPDIVSGERSRRPQRWGPFNRKSAPGDGGT